VNDQQLLESGIKRLECLLAELPDATGLMLEHLLIRYRETKESLAAVVAQVNAATICAECGGQCCLNGKYRLNVLDAMARAVAKTETPADFTQKPLCPYSSADGCTMEPGLRPADCVLFICDAINRKLSPQSRLQMAGQEQVLRRCIQEASELTGKPLGTPLLIWAEH
jgi:predicted metal-binding protein